MVFMLTLSHLINTFEFISRPHYMTTVMMLYWLAVLLWWLQLDHDFSVWLIDLMNGWPVCVSVGSVRSLLYARLYMTIINRPHL